MIKIIRNIFFWIVFFPMINLAMLVHNSYKMWLYIERLNGCKQVLPEDEHQKGNNGKSDGSNADAKNESQKNNQQSEN